VMLFSESDSTYEPIHSLMSLGKGRAEREEDCAEVDAPEPEEKAKEKVGPVYFHCQYPVWVC
jgi:hypothetical protein